MKKYISIILSLTLILCLVSCDLSGIWGAFGSTADTSISTTTTATTVPKDPDKIETLEDYFELDKIDTAIYFFSSADHSFSYSFEKINDIDNFFDLFIYTKNQNITNDTAFIADNLSTANKLAKEASNYYRRMIFSISFYDEVGALYGAIHVYPNGTAYIQGDEGDYITIDENAVDWELLMRTYFYFEVEL
jgi:hypothetical protein